MKAGLSFMFALLLICLQDADSWLFGGSSRGKSLADKAADAGRFAAGAARGAGEMGRAYLDMRRANWKNSDKYFHARGNHDAAKHGPGGRWAAEKISDAREAFDRRFKGDSAASSAADQAANRWGRNGGDPNVFRPRGLPSKY